MQTTLIVLELKKLGIELDMPPNKLKTGNGDGVCAVLNKLCTVSVQNKIKFKKAVIKDDAGMDDEGDDAGDDMEGNADIADMANNQQEDDDIEDFAGDGVDKQDNNELIQNQIIQSSISREEWMLEVERVAHKLKINDQRADGGKEWRAHLDQTKKYADQVKGALPDVRIKLERLSEDVSKALERISKKEGVLSKSF